MKWILFFFSCILFLAAGLRLYRLGTFPSGLTWDEAAIGYNAYGIRTVHRDEWLNRMPIAFRSFGDYKSSLAVYAVATLLFFTQLTPLIVRLPSALAGIGLVVVSFFLTKELFSLLAEHDTDDGKSSAVTYSNWIALFVMLLTALSPWAIHFSRIGFESMIAAFLTSFGALAWLLGRKNPLWYILGDLAFVTSLYAYHSAKVVVPLMILVLGAILWRSFLRTKKAAAIGTILAMLVALPLIYATLYEKANDRAISTTILGKDKALTRFFANMQTHLSPAFLLEGSDITYRHGTKQQGVLYPIELGLIAIGMLAIGFEKKLRKLWFVPVLFLVGLVPASLGIDVPHANRAVLALPWGQITAGIGLLACIRCVSYTAAILHSSYSRIQWQQIGIGFVVSGIFILLAVSLQSYIRLYGSVYSSNTALRELGYGYEEAITYARSKESEVSRVYFTNTYGQAYIYLLFFKQLTPIEYQGGGLANYVITDNPWNDAKGQSNVLVVGTKDQIPDDQNIVQEISYPDGEVAFRIVKQ